MQLPVELRPVEKPYKLTNDGRLEIVFLGVGSAFAIRNNQLNFLIVKGDTHVLVDFGMTGPKALNQVCGLKATDIGTILPTHSHADHVGGVECLGLMNRYVGIPILKRPKMKMIITTEYLPILWDQTLRGGMQWNERVDNAHTLDVSDFFDIVTPEWVPGMPRPVFRTVYGGIELELFRTKHIPSAARGWENSFVSYGLLVDGHVWLSIDTRFDTELIDMYAPFADVMFHDAQLFTPESVHATLEDLRTLPADVKSKMFLMHYGDNWESQSAAGFAGWAEQGLRYIFETDEGSFENLRILRAEHAHLLTGQLR